MRPSNIIVDRPLSLGAIRWLAGVHDALAYVVLGEGSKWARWPRTVSGPEIKGWSLEALSDAEGPRGRLDMVIDATVIPKDLAVPAELYDALVSAWRSYIGKSRTTILVQPSYPPIPQDTTRVIAAKKVKVSPNLKDGYVLPGMSVLALEAERGIQVEELLALGLRKEALVRPEQGGSWKVCLGPGSMYRRACDTCFYVTAYDRPQGAWAFVTESRLTYEIDKGQEAFMQGGPGFAKELCQDPNHDFNHTNFIPADNSNSVRSLSLCRGWDVETTADDETDSEEEDESAIESAAVTSPLTSAPARPPALTSFTLEMEIEDDDDDQADEGEGDATLRMDALEWSDGASANGDATLGLDGAAVDTRKVISAAAMATVVGLELSAELGSSQRELEDISVRKDVSNGQISEQDKRPLQPSLLDPGTATGSGSVAPAHIAARPNRIKRKFSATIICDPDEEDEEDSAGVSIIKTPPRAQFTSGGKRYPSQTLLAALEAGPSSPFRQRPNRRRVMSPDEMDLDGSFFRPMALEVSEPLGVAKEADGTAYRHALPTPTPTLPDEDVGVDDIAAVGPSLFITPELRAKRKPIKGTNPLGKMYRALLSRRQGQAKRLRMAEQRIKELEAEAAETNHAGPSSIPLETAAAPFARINCLSVPLSLAADALGVVSRHEYFQPPLVPPPAISAETLLPTYLDRYRKARTHEQVLFECLVKSMSSASEEQREEIRQTGAKRLKELGQYWGEMDVTFAERGEPHWMARVKVDAKAAGRVTAQPDLAMSLEMAALRAAASDAERTHLQHVASLTLSNSNLTSELKRAEEQVAAYDDQFLLLEQKTQQLCASYVNAHKAAQAAIKDVTALQAHAKELQGREQAMTKMAAVEELLLVKQVLDTSGVRIEHVKANGEAGPQISLILPGQAPRLLPYPATSLQAAAPLTSTELAALSYQHPQTHPHQPPPGSNLEWLRDPRNMPQMPFAAPAAAPPPGFMGRFDPKKAWVPHGDPNVTLSNHEPAPKPARKKKKVA